MNVKILHMLYMNTVWLIFIIICFHHCSV